MANSLNIYAGITPNIARNPYILSHTKAGYIDDLTPYLLLTVAPNAYEFTDINVIRLRPTNSIANMYNATYAVFEGSQGARQCYHITNVSALNGYYLLNIELDKWGTYINDANISNIFVKRCNRNIGYGTFDPIETPEEFTRAEIYQSNVSKVSFNINDLYVVFTVLREVKQSTLFGNSAVSTLEMYAAPIESPREQDTPAEKISYTLSQIGGIYAYTTSLPQPVEKQAAATRVFIVPKLWLQTKERTPDSPIFKTVSTYAGYVDGTISTAKRVIPTWTPYQPTDIFIAPNAERQQVIGTAYDGITLPRSTQNEKATIYCIVKQDGLQIFVTANGENKDITNAFEVGIVKNDGNVTALEKATTVLSAISTFTAAGASVASGNYLGGALLAGQALTGIAKPGKSNFTPGGDGLSTFMPNADTINPFYIQYYDSRINETAKAGLYGATFCEKIDALEDLTLFDKFDAAGTNLIYTQCDASVDGIPAEAAEEIRAALATGIYLRVII